VVRFGSVGGLTDAGLYLAMRRVFHRIRRFGKMQRTVQRAVVADALATGQLDVAGIR